MPWGEQVYLSHQTTLVPFHTKTTNRHNAQIDTMHNACEQPEKKHDWEDYSGFPTPKQTLQLCLYFLLTWKPVIFSNNNEKPQVAGFCMSHYEASATSMTLDSKSSKFERIGEREFLVRWFQCPQKNNAWSPTLGS